MSLKKKGDIIDKIQYHVLDFQRKINYMNFYDTYLLVE